MAQVVQMASCCLDMGKVQAVSSNYRMFLLHVLHTRQELAFLEMNYPSHKEMNLLQGRTAPTYKKGLLKHPIEEETILKDRYSLSDY